MKYEAISRHIFSYPTSFGFSCENTFVNETSRKSVTEHYLFYVCMKEKDKDSHREGDRIRERKIVKVVSITYVALNMC